MTPPALHKTSGKNFTPLDKRILSASIVVGPFAASTISLQLNLSALFLLTDFSKAAGTKISLYY